MNKKIISGLVATLGVIAPVLAFAQTDLVAPTDDGYDYNYDDSAYYNNSYDYNYDYNYDYDEDLSGAATAVGVTFVIIAIVGGLFFLVATAFTIWMIVDAAKRDFDQKVMWIILMVLFNPLVAIIYFFMVRRKNVTRTNPHGGSSGTTPSAAK